MADRKYGRLFTMTDVQQLVNVARLDGAPQDVKDLIADWDSNQGLVPFTFPENEPQMVLRAKDVAATPTICADGEISRDYYGNAQAAGASIDHLVRVTQTSYDFREWQRQRPESVKIPD